MENCQKQIVGVILLNQWLGDRNMGRHGSALWVKTVGEKKMSGRCLTSGRLWNSTSARVFLSAGACGGGWPSSRDAHPNTPSSSEVLPPPSSYTWGKSRRVACSWHICTHHGLVLTPDWMRSRHNDAFWPTEHTFYRQLILHGLRVVAFSW